MVNDLHGLMKELLSQIRHGTLEACRKDLAQHVARSQTRAEPLSALFPTMAEKSVNQAQETGQGKSAGSFLLHTAALRLLENLADAGQKRDLAALRQTMKKRLDECRMACILLREGAGSASKSWENVQVVFPEQDGDGLDVRIGTITIPSDDLREVASDLDWDFTVPALLPFGQGKAVCVTAPAVMRERVVSALESVALRLLLAKAPGRMRLTVLDPAMSYFGMTRLLPESGIVASSASQIETILEEILHHMEQGIVPCTREEDRGGKEPSAGEIAAARQCDLWWTIIVLDGEQLSARAMQTLRTIIRSGGRCGVFTLMHWLNRESQHERQRLLELAAGCTLMSWDPAKNAFIWQEEGLEDGLLHFDGLPADDIVLNILRPVTKAWHVERAKDTEERKAKRYAAVSFSGLLERGNLEDEANWWSGDSASDFEGLLGLAIEGSELGEPVACRFGRGAEHALLAGVTGSGKNNLLNVLLATLAIRYSPEELEFFMIDLKEGVEFQRFARCGLPHARAISVSNDIEFAQSILLGLDMEMENRGRLFTASGATNIAEYRKKTGNRLSRILLVVDEAKTLYGGGDSSYALAFFDKMAAKGRSFGLHLLLANQSFSGASLRLSTITNMGIRLVTKGKGDRVAENVLESSNAVLENLSQHEAVYNDGQGSKEHNHSCRVPQWTDSDDEYIRRLARKAPSGFRKPVVFDGHERPLLSSCLALNGERVPLDHATGPQMWIGAPMSLQESASVEWMRESKQNFLIVDSDEEQATGLAVAASTSLLLTVPPQDQQFYILDLGTPRKTWSDALTSTFKAAGQRVVLLRREDILERISSLAAVVEQRNNSGLYDEPSVFLVLHGIHRLRELHNAPSSVASKMGAGGQRTLSEVLASILRDGPYVGVHVLAWCDTAENVRRLLGDTGKLRGEFGMVAAGKQTDDTFSRNLVGSGKAATLGTNRMVFANSGGSINPFVFRPYGLPDNNWLEAVAGRRTA